VGKCVRGVSFICPKKVLTEKGVRGNYVVSEIMGEMEEK